MKHFFLLSLLLSSILTDAQTNLIKNGGFEYDLANWNGQENGALSPYDKKSGKKCAFINQFTGAEWRAFDQTISLAKNTYALECNVWMKAEEVENQKEDYKAAAVILEFTNGADKQIATETIARAKGTTDWVNYKKNIKVPAEAKKIRIMLALVQTNGTVFFDDIKVTTLSEEDYFKLNPIVTVTESPKMDSPSKTFSNGGFEENLNSWNGSAILSTTDKKEGNTAAEITSNTAEWKAIDQVADIKDGDKTIEISGWLKAKNIQQGKDPWNNGMLIIEFKKDEATKASEDQVIGSVSGTTDWTSFKKTLPIPDGAKKYRIMLAMSACTGTLLADNVEVKLSK